MSELTTALDGLGTGWTRRDPASQERVTDCERELDVSFPQDYREFLKLSNGGSLKGEATTVNFIPLDELPGFNEDEEIVSHMPGILAIADNGGGSFYYYDVANRLGRGAWALYLVGFGTLSFEDSRFVGASLTEMIAAIAAGENLERRPFVE